MLGGKLLEQWKYVENILGIMLCVDKLQPYKFCSDEALISMLVVNILENQIYIWECSTNLQLNVIDLLNPLLIIMIIQGHSLYVCRVHPHTSYEHICRSGCQ